jgi:ATP-dependent Lon protease
MPIGDQGGQSTVAAPLSNAVLDACRNYATVDFSALVTGSKSQFSLPSTGDPSLLANTGVPLLLTSIEQKQHPLETST